MKIQPLARLAFAALAALATPSLGCAEKPVASSPSSNPKIEVQTLLTHDGCTVYRFRDGYYHYFVRCKGEAGGATPQTVSTIRCAQSCKRHFEEIETIATER